MRQFTISGFGEQEDSLFVGKLLVDRGEGGELGLDLQFETEKMARERRQLDQGPRLQLLHKS